MVTRAADPRFDRPYNTLVYQPMIELLAYLRANDNFGMEIEISREVDLLDTGGGLKRAAHFFLKDGVDEPFVLHNVDILTDIDLHAMLRFHRERR